MAARLDRFNFCLRNSTFLNNRVTLAVDLLIARYTSSTGKRNRHSGRNLKGDLEECSSRVPDVPVSDMNYLYRSHRENSLRLRKHRNDFFTRASQAYSRGQGNLARILSQKGRMINFAIRHSDLESSAEILNSNYRNLTPSYYRTLNLHGLHVREAIQVVHEFLDGHNQGEGRLRVITGWGRNSYPRQPQLLPALIEMLEKQGRYFEEVRPGVVEIFK